MSTEKVQVAVIGGGIVGCSVLYWLTRMGWTDAVLLEKNELTSGSTWHAAGNTTFFGHYPSITALYTNSVKTYLAAEEETDQAVSFHAAGSIRLANDKAELESYQRLEPMYDKLGIDYEVIGSDKIQTVHPLLVTDNLLGAAYTPTDGHLDPSGATHAVAKAARQRGAEIRRNNPVIRIEQTRNNSWLLHTGNDIIHTEHVVLASSFWTRELAQPLGLNIPVYATKHQALVTEAIPALKNLSFEVPTIRDSYGQFNMRQEGKGLLAAVYEPDPEFWATDGIPPDFNQELFEPNLDRIETDFGRVIERVPAFAEAGIKQIVNGPICYTPDALPLLGPVETHTGLWLACGFCIGVGTGGGSAEFLANWMIDGKPPYDLPVIYPSRFSAEITREECLKRITATYATGYRMSA